MSTVAVNGVFVGLVYALIGVGLVIVYRGSRVINFAHGETGMVSAFVFSDLWAIQHLPLAIALPLAISLAAALGALTEVVVVRPLREQPRLVVMVGTFAMSALFLAFATRRWGLNPHYIEPVVQGAGIPVAGLRIQPIQLLILATTLVLLAGIGALYRYTSFGLRLRATALDPFAAAQVGVNINLTSMATWALAGAVAGTSAILIAPLVSFNVYFMTQLLIRGIAAALVGGLTSLWGAAIAGVGIGVAEAMIGYKTAVPGIVEVSLAALIIVLLLVRPAGLVRSSY